MPPQQTIQIVNTNTKGGQYSTQLDNSAHANFNT